MTIRYGKYLNPDGICYKCKYWDFKNRVYVNQFQRDYAECRLWLIPGENEPEDENLETPSVFRCKYFKQKEEKGK